MSWKLPIAAHTLACGTLISMDSRTFCRVGPWAQLGAKAAVAAIPATASAATAAFVIVTFMSFPQIVSLLPARLTRADGHRSAVFGRIETIVVVTPIFGAFT